MTSVKKRGIYIAFVVYFTYLCITMANEQTSVRDRVRSDLKEPRRYKVIIFNDDFTTN